MLPFHAALLIPSSLTEQEPDPRVRTFKVGMVGRAAAIFGVREVVVYTEPTYNDARFIETVLRYQECPPYLRKRLFKLAPELQYAGVLPPLNTPAHTAPREARVGDVREGVADRGVVQMGTTKPGKAMRPLPEGERVAVRIAADLGREYAVVPHDDPAHHGGFAVRRADGLAEALLGYDACIATSREGEPAARVPLEKLRGKVALAFGPPGLSVEEVVAREKAEVRWDFRLNAAPGQGTETVRTEEAVLLSLAALAAATAK